MKIRELTAATDIPERQVRYLIAEGFISAPRGGRSNADYGDDHVSAIRRYTRLRELGFPPAAIKLLLEAREGAPFPGRAWNHPCRRTGFAGQRTGPEPILDRIRKHLTDILKEAKDAAVRTKR